jgi:hypothetical protein
MDMHRVLALQGLESLTSDELAFDSTQSFVCSSQSGAQGASSCSGSCYDVDQMQW